MPDTPVVSILLPAFEAEATLPACLRSVRRQTEPGWECVIVDDGSRDGTLACARTFAARDDRFVVVSTSHRGLVPALEVGLGQTIHGAPVIAYKDLPRIPRRPVVVSVAGDGPRRRIREALEAMGLRETRDFVCTA